MLKKGALLFLTIILSSCGIFHFFSPGANNSIYNPGWKHYDVKFNVDSAKDFSIAVDNENKLHLAYSEPTNNFLRVLKLDSISGGWSSEYSTNLMITNVELYYSAEFGLHIQFITSGGYCTVMRPGDFGWQQYGPTLILTTTTVADLSQLGPNHLDLVYFDPASATKSIFTFKYNDNGGASWNDWTSSMETGSEILDLSVDTLGFPVVAAAHQNYIQLFCWKNSTEIHDFAYSNSFEFAKVAAFNENDIYVVSRGKDFSVVLLHFAFIDGNISLNGSSVIYRNGFYIEAQYQPYGMSLTAHKPSGTFYLSLIGDVNKNPMVFKINKGVTTPILGLPSDLTNCIAAKVAVDIYGKPILAALSATHQLRMFWLQ
ncbi:MAG: hypothetical protein A2Y33_14760 [Spirochaetes bacterium GWF1_51_8]|nr:MAG: hypothetical protein A2Y33_14760 [Spirochaetes bacterium GWF1_51_8]